ncbi:uncharacterized protein LOC142348027 [Convolutriloba macropyga]|uniref:uncharacterized protein LOC142348027 n=1 Tax=Convolutriloba macropyga TaxID=536237 RepID=UPI003F526C72
MTYLTLENCGFYLTIFDITSLSDEDVGAEIYTDWRVDPKCYSDLGYKSDVDVDGATTTTTSSSTGDEDHVNKAQMQKDISQQVLRTAALEEGVEFWQQEISSYKVCCQLTESDEVAVTLLAKAVLFNTMESFANLFRELLTNLDYNGLLMSGTLKNLTTDAATSHVLQSMLNYIMNETFKTWSEVYNNPATQSNRSGGGAGGLNSRRASLTSAGQYSMTSSVFDQTSNWLTECGYYDLWDQQRKQHHRSYSPDGEGEGDHQLLNELMQLVNACEQEIQSIKRGYREFSKNKNSIVIPVEDWDLEASTTSSAPGQDEEVPRAMSELQTLDHLVQQAQIIQFKLDRLELLSLREARQIPNSDPLVKEIEEGLSRQRNALHHLNSSFVIEADIIFEETEGIISRNNGVPQDPASSSQQNLLLPGESRRRRSKGLFKCCTIL